MYICIYIYYFPSIFIPMELSWRHWGALVHSPPRVSLCPLGCYTLFNSTSSDWCPPPSERCLELGLPLALVTSLSPSLPLSPSLFTSPRPLSHGFQGKGTLGVLVPGVGKTNSLPQGPKFAPILHEGFSAEQNPAVISLRRLSLLVLNI